MDEFPQKDLIENSTLWEDFKQGDEKAFSEIFRKNYSILYNYGIKLCTDSDLTKDCIQELFITLWKNKKNLGPTTSIKFYLLKSLRRKIIRLKSELEVFNMNLEDYDFEIEFSIENVIIANQIREEQQEYFLKILNKLSKRQKEVIYLKFYQNLSYEEIGETMDLSYQSVRNYVHQAISSLRKQIKAPTNILYLLLYLSH